MTRLVALALLAASCGRGVDQFPVGTGGGGTQGGVTTPDAAADSNGDGGATLTGRVCLITDARSPLTCATSGADGLTVKLGTSTTTTTDGAGHFTIATPSGTNLYWRVAATNATVASAIAFSANNTIPVLGSDLYSQMGGANNVAVGDGSGAIIAKLTHGGTALSGATAIVTPPQEQSTVIFYDGPTAVGWQANQTGSFGVVWVPGMAETTAQLAIGGPATGSVTGIPVFANTITFVFAEIP